MIKVNDMVKIPDYSGNLAKVTEIINNKLAKTEHTETIKKYGKKQPITVTGTYPVTSLRKEDEQYKNSAVHEKNRFGTNVDWNGIQIEIVELNTKLERLYEWYAMKQLELNPSYQRELVWTQSQKQEYIEAILKERAEITPVLILKGTSDIHEVLDGKQRLTSIIEYLENKFALKSGEYFKDLSRKDTTYFLNAPVKYKRILAYDVEMEVPLDFKLAYFLEINAKGTKVSEDHIRKIENELDKITKGWYSQLFLFIKPNFDKIFFIYYNYKKDRLLI